MKKYWEIELSALLTIGILAAFNMKEAIINQQTKAQLDGVFE